MCCCEGMDSDVLYLLIWKQRCHEVCSEFGQNGFRLKKLSATCFRREGISIAARDQKAACFHGKEESDLGIY